MQRLQHGPIAQAIGVTILGAAKVRSASLVVRIVRGSFLAARGSSSSEAGLNKIIPSFASHLKNAINGCVSAI